ncbi:hypothetical protein ACHAPS_008797 [Verticillium nonalfalfae]
MARNVCITAAEGQTGFLIAELLLKHPLPRKVDSVTAFTMDPTSDRVKALDSLGATVSNTAASEVLRTEIEFENISRAEAEKVLRALSESDNMERQSILDYFSLVRKGKISPTAFHDVAGTHPTEPTGFFEMRSGEFKTAKRGNGVTEVATRRQLRAGFSWWGC